MSHRATVRFLRDSTGGIKCSVIDPEEDALPASRRQVFEKIRHLVSPTMPFANLPDTHKSRWGDELTAEKMKECVWLRPEAVAQIEFLEWTAGDRLRHAKFAGLREDKDARQVGNEYGGE